MINILDTRRAYTSPVKAAIVAMSLLLIISAGLFCPAKAEPQLNMPTTLAAPKRAKPAESVANQLLIMASPSADGDDVKESLDAVHGTVVKTIGDGAQKIYVVQTESGKGEETEKKLKSDEHFSMVQKNYQLKIQASPPPPPVNDPYFSSEWHLGGVSAVGAWTKYNAKGAGITVAVLDTGCPANGSDLAGKCYSGYDAVLKRQGQGPSTEHGSMVATTLGAATNNKRNTAAVAPDAYIFPCKISNSKGVISEDAILEGIYYAGMNGLKIINLSANSDPPHSLSNASEHPGFHSYAKWYHDQKGGILFLAAGNEQMEDKSAFAPYLCVISALDKNYSLASFSNYGNNLWFTAPGVGIYCTDSRGRVSAVDGTSFSSPCAAGVAALVWSSNRSLTNKQVESIMASTCYRAGGQTYTKYYGYGLLNAEAAVKKAKGL